jgi:choline dehydrogenase
LIPPNYHFDNPKDSYFNFFVTLMNSQSRGDITLANADPSEKPVINPNYLENSYDRLVLKTAIRESLKWMEAPSLKKFVKSGILTPESDSDIDIEVNMSKKPLWIR